VASATEAILVFDADTFEPLSFDFPAAGAGGCGDVVVSGSALLAAMHSPERAFPVSVQFGTD
jgi:hypothetical protein